MHTDRWLDVLFGKGDDDFPFWLMAIRVNILLFLLCAVLVVVWSLGRNRRPAARSESAIVLALTALGAALRFLVASANLMDFGGIPYSRLLLGYKGHFATAQFYSLFYEWTARDIEHAILFDRIAGTVTVPLVYLLCRRLHPDARLFPTLAAFLFAVSPLHVMLSASDALPAFSIFLTAASYCLLAGAGVGEPPAIRIIRHVGGLAGLTLLTQVRYENALFFVPPALFAVARRDAMRARDIAPAILVAGAFLAFYAYEAVTAGLSFQNPVVLSDGVERVFHHLVLNPFLAVPSLLVGTLGIWWSRGIGAGLLSLLPYAAAFALAILADTGHGGARVYGGWLILILPIAAHGFSLMLESGRRAARLVALVALVHLATQPLVLHDHLGARYLEIRENDAFRQVLAKLPTGVEQVIVPDDELLRRHTHSTNEVYNKYAMILAGRRDAAPGPRLVRLTDFLERPAPGSCAGNACVFFFGLPCLEQHVYPLAREQCLRALEAHPSSAIFETTMVAAPFLDCAIYTGRGHRRLCEPRMKRHTIAAYRIEG